MKHKRREKHARPRQRYSEIIQGQLTALAAISKEITPQAAAGARG